MIAELRMVDSQGEQDVFSLLPFLDSDAR